VDKLAGQHPRLSSPWRRGLSAATIRSPVADAVLGYREVVGRRLHAVFVCVLHDGKLLGLAEHARSHLGYDRRCSGANPRSDFRTIRC